MRTRTRVDQHPDLARKIVGRMQAVVARAPAAIAELVGRLGRPERAETFARTGIRPIGNGRKTRYMKWWLTPRTRSRRGRDLPSPTRASLRKACCAISDETSLVMAQLAIDRRHRDPAIIQLARGVKELHKNFLPGWSRAFDLSECVQAGIVGRGRANFWRRRDRSAAENPLRY